MKHSVRSCLANKRIRLLYWAGGLGLLAAFLAGIFLGSTPLSLSDVQQAFVGGFSSTAGARIFGFVRLTRTLSSLLCGAALAVSGVVIQGVLANRLASPSIIGVNAGAGLAVTACAVLGIYHGAAVSLFAFVGALVTVLLVSLAARKWRASRSTVILIGVAVNSLLSAVRDALLTFFPEAGVISNGFRVGEFSSVTYERLSFAAGLILISILLIFSWSNDLDVLSLGEESAGALGMNTARMRTWFLVLAALCAGCAVSLAGLLSFVGLIVPHVVRRLTGTTHTVHVLGLSALYGAAFVCVCDTLSRTLFAPYEIPVGILMAFLGAPFFLLLLLRAKGGKRVD